MNHLTLRGTHWEVGFQWGARLAERGLRLLDHVPFSLTAERRAFAAACRPAYARHFPAALEELAGLAAGQNCTREDLETVLFTIYALPPACGCSCLAVSNGNGVFFGRNSDFLTALEPYNTHAAYQFSDGAIPFAGNTTSFVQMEDAVNARGLAVGLTSVYTPRPRPGLNAGMVLRLLADPLPPGLDTWRAAERYDTMRRVLEREGGDAGPFRRPDPADGEKGLSLPVRPGRGAGHCLVRSLRPDPAALPAGGGQPGTDGLPGDSLPSGAGERPPLTPAARPHTIERNLTKRRG